MKAMFRNLAMLLLCGILSVGSLSAQSRGGQRGNSNGGRQNSSVNAGSGSRPGASARPSVNNGAQMSRPTTARPSNEGTQMSRPSNSQSVSSGNFSRPENRPGTGSAPSQGTVNNRPANGGNQPQGGYNRPGNGGGSSVNPPQGGNDRPGGVNPPQSGNRPDNGGSFTRPDYGRPGQGNAPGNNGPGHNGPSAAPGHGPGHGPSAGPAHGYDRPGVPPPGVRPPHDARPPMWRPAPAPWIAPRPPHHWHAVGPMPTFSTILGITLGMGINYTLNYLLPRGYIVNAYGPDVIYLNDVNQLNFYWPDAALYYNGHGGLARGEFIYSTSYYDTARYNAVYSRLVASYGNPVATMYPAGGFQTQWFGPDGRFVTLTYQPQYGADGIYRYYTTLTFGN